MVMGRLNLILVVTAAALFGAATVIIINLGGKMTPSPDVVRLKSKLPYALEHTAAVYDGEDTIYLVGGDNRGSKCQTMLKFSIRSETVEEVDPLTDVIPPWHLPGTAVYNSEDKLIYYFCGSCHGFGVAVIPTLKPESGEFISGKKDALFLGYPSGVWDPVGRKAYFLGMRWFGWVNGTQGKGLWRFDPYAKDAKHSLSLVPFPFEAFHAGMMYCRRDGLIYILGGTVVMSHSATKHLDTIAAFNPATGTVSFLDTRLPHGVDAGTFGWDEQLGTAYILEEEGMTTFGPSTKETTYEPFPQGTLDNHLFLSGAVYVPGLRRMYIFGGEESARVVLVQL